MDLASREEGQGKGGEILEPSVNSASVPGGIITSLSDGKESIVGWLQAAGTPHTNSTIADAFQLEPRTLSTNILTQKIPLEFYGTAYHNAAIVLFAVLSTRVITLLRLSWGWIIILLAFCMSMYSISIERTRKRARDDILREVVKVRLVSETESADWINSLLDRAWLIAEPLLSGEHDCVLLLLLYAPRS